MPSLGEQISQRIGGGADPGLADRIKSRLGPQPESDTIAWQVNQKELGPPGMEDIGLRFKINAADTFKEKFGAFRSTFPQGDLTKDIMSDTLIFREDPSQPYKKVDADLLEKFEPLQDLVDFTASDLGAISGEMLAAARTRGVSLLGLLGRLFAGGSAGEYAQEYIEPSIGVPQEESYVDEITPRAAGKGVVAGIGGVVGMGIEKGINAVRGAGTFGVKPEAEGVMKSADRMGLPPLMPQQVTTSPFIQRLASQAGAVSEKIPVLVQQQEAAVMKRLDSLRDPVDAERATQELASLHTRERKEILSKAIVAGTSAEQAGKALMEGKARYENLSKLYVDGAYEAARKIDTPQFDLNPIYRAIDEITTGAPARGIKGETLQGQAPLPRVLQDVIGKLKAFDPNAPDIVKDGKVLTKTDFLKNLRSQLWDLKTPPVGEPVRQEQALAGKLYRAITDVMDNPVSGNPEFVSAWKNASQIARDRFDTLEKNIVIEAGRTQTPERLADRLAQPLNSSNLDVLRRVTGVSKYFQMQDFFKTKLVQNADELTASLSKFDDETIRKLLSPDEQSAFREIGSRIDKLNSMQLPSRLSGARNAADAVQRAVVGGGAENIDEIYRMVQKAGGPDSKTGKAIRAALIEDVWQDVITIPRGQAAEKVVLQKLASKLTQMREAGAMKFLTPSDISDLRDLHLYKSLMESGGDVGTSIQAAETISSASRFSGAAMVKLAQYAGMGRMITSGAGRRILTGTGSKKLDMPRLKAFSGALATLTADFEEE